jgi:hypothetical protein
MAGCDCNGGNPVFFQILARTQKSPTHASGQNEGLLIEKISKKIKAMRVMKIVVLLIFAKRPAARSQHLIMIGKAIR